METSIVTSPRTDIVPDLVINRSRDHVIAKELENDGSIVVNDSETTRVCNDKASTYRMAEGLDIPHLEYSLDGLPSGPPWVVKSRSGHGGTAVHLCHDPDEALGIAGTMPDPLIQSVAKDLGRDMRIYMLDGEPLASVMRHNCSDFRANFKLGGQAELCEPHPDALRYAREICKGLEAVFVGVDFVFSDGVPYLNEVEDAVGTRMLYSLTDLDPARLLMESAHSKMSL